jgi:hypothetical protein
MIAVQKPRPRCGVQTNTTCKCAVASLCASMRSLFSCAREFALRGRRDSLGRESGGGGVLREEGRGGVLT